ncbi:serpin family protein [Hallella faecis]|uniref:serpin family protein n=1 Tax=Hallella faecis TaxID=2841596 RepID=UPI003F8E2ADC
MKKSIVHMGHAAVMAALAATTLGSCATQKNHQKTDNSMNATKIESNLDEQYLILSDAEQKAVAQTNDFAFNLFRTQEGMDSKVLSPISVAYLMGMLANGAEGATQAEIMKALGQDGTSLQTLNDAYKSIINHTSALDRRTQINIANCITVNKQVTFKNEYATAMKALFEAQVESMDFTSPKTLSKINGWCAKQTNGMIPKIVDQLDANATAVLMNAIYFNGTWASKFDKSQTKTEEFRGFTRDIKKVDMMQQEHKFMYADNKDYAAVTLPYGNGTYSMTVILPAEGKSTTEVAQQLNAKNFAELQANMTECLVDLKLPRFSTTTETPLNQPISALGAPSIFQAGQANFSNMTDAPMYVSTMLQKAKIEVSEKGTKAAAVTAAIMTMSMYQPDEPRHVVFHANRPFIYMITERVTNTIFFIGQYTGPTE